MPFNRRSIISDEYSYESVDTTTVRYVPPPLPIIQPRTSVSLFRCPSPTPTLTFHRCPSPVRLYRSPSLHSISFNRSSRPKSFRQTTTWRNNDESVDIRVETENEFKRITPITNDVITTSFVSYNDDSIEKKTDYSYKYEESFETKKQVSSLPRARSCLNICETNKNDLDVGTTTYVYNSNDNDRHVTYVKQTENDSGLSLAGCLVKASPTFLPVNRSLQLGAIFNGNSFGLLTEHLQIKDSFNVSFDFKTTCRNGLLMILVDSITNDSFFIELYDSQLKATLYIDGEPDSCWTDFPTPILSNDVWINVNLQMIGNRMQMTCKNEFFTKHHRHHLRSPIRGDLFVAGYPSTIVPPYVCHSKDFFYGEMRNFYVNNDGIKWYGIPGSLYPRLRNWY